MTEIFEFIFLDVLFPLFSWAIIYLIVFIIGLPAILLISLFGEGEYRKKVSRSYRGLFDWCNLYLDEYAHQIRETFLN